MQNIPKMRNLFVCFIFTTLFHYGISENSERFRVVNGEQVGQMLENVITNEGPYPFVAYLKVLRRNANDLDNGICTGSIIRTDVVLTAAHCVDGAAAKAITVYGGMVYKGNWSIGVQVRISRNYTMHKNYDKVHQPFRHDIALIFLHSPFEITNTVNLIELPTASDYINDSELTALGWGVNEKGDDTEWLQKTKLFAILNEKCQSFADEVNKKLITGSKMEITMDMMCAMNQNKSTICSGDSGGPLVYRNKVVGVTAWTLSRTPIYYLFGKYTCDPYYPSVFMRVLDYVAWINKQL